MSKMIATIKKAGLREKIKIIIRGTPLLQQFAYEIVADIFDKDIMIKVIRNLLSESKK